MEIENLGFKSSNRSSNRLRAIEIFFRWIGLLFQLIIEASPCQSVILIYVSTYDLKIDITKDKPQNQKFLRSFF